MVSIAHGDTVELDRAQGHQNAAIQDIEQPHGERREVDHDLCDISDSDSQGQSAGEDDGSDCSSDSEPGLFEVSLDDLYEVGL